jgi:hypothetical protein
MKDIKLLTILCSILFLSAMGCSDYDNGISENLEQMEENQYEKEAELKAKKEEVANEVRDLKLNEIKADEEADQKNTDAISAVELYREDERKQDIDRYKDSEIKKRDKDGNKTYWENEQDSEF